MKKLLRISSLMLVLLLLAGCSTNPQTGKQTNNEPSAEVTAPTFDEPTVPTASNPTEATAPGAEPPAANPAAAAGFEAVYKEICGLLDSGNTEQDFTYVSAGIMEVSREDSIAARYSSITYALEDLDGDGKQEMIVLNSMGNTQILAIYALQDGQPVMTHEGFSRSRLYRLSDGQLYMEGSNGAAYSLFKVGSQCWFTYPNADMTDIDYYYAADGTYDPAAAQQITAAEYEAKQIEFSQKISAFSVYSFTQ